MKLTNTQLKQIIREELRSILSENWQKAMFAVFNRVDERIFKSGQKWTVDEIMEAIKEDHYSRNSKWPMWKKVKDWRLRSPGPLNNYEMEWPYKIYQRLDSLLDRKASDWDEWDMYFQNSHDQFTRSKTQLYRIK